MGDPHHGHRLPPRPRKPRSSHARKAERSHGHDRGPRQPDPRARPAERDGADEAKRSVDRFVGDSQTTVASVKAGARQIQSYGTGAQNVAAVALPLGLQLEHLVTEGQTTVGDLETIKGPFQHAVKKSKACQALKPSDDSR